jgi:hypothetical protein
VTFRLAWLTPTDRDRRTVGKRLALAIFLCGVAAGAVAVASPNRPAPRVAHYEYVTGAERLSVYNIPDGALVGRFALPGVTEIRGIGASAVTGMPYVSYGGSREASVAC